MPANKFVKRRITAGLISHGDLRPVLLGQFIAAHPLGLCCWRGAREVIRRSIAVKFTGIVAVYKPGFLLPRNEARGSEVDFFRDVAKNGLSATLAEREMWNQMRMNPTDLSDISAYTYTYLMNGVTPAGNWTGLFRPGEKVRLRIINSGAMTFLTCASPGSR